MTMMTIVRRASVVLGILLLPMGVQSGLKAESFLVVVNAANSYSADEAATLATVRRVFLKEIKDWPGGPKAVPFAPKAGKAEYEALLASVLGQTQSEVDAYWARLKQTTGDTPPRAVGSASILVKLLGREEGAIGLISADDEAKLGDGVRILLRIEN